MGRCRFLYDNLITSADMLTVSSLRSGLVTAAIKDGTGSASLTPFGAFSGTSDREFVVRIDSIAGGAEVGEATYKWSLSGGASWEATGVTTSGSNTLLAEGVYIRFTGGTGDDFAWGDTWRFKAVNHFNPARLLDTDRDRRYRSAGLDGPNHVEIDLEEAGEARALILYDHNLTPEATVTLMGDDDASWGSPAFSETVPVSSGRIIHYLSAPSSYRYWRVEISDPSNPDGYVEIGHLYLGPYLELSRTWRPGRKRTDSYLVAAGTTSYGVRKLRYFNTAAAFSYELGFLTDSDLDALRAMRNALVSRDEGRIRPVFFHEDPDLGYFCLAWLDDLPDTWDLEDVHQVSLTLTEAQRSV